MTMVLGKVDTMEQGLSEAEELRIDVEEIGCEEGFPEVDITPLEGESEVVGGSLNLYFTQFGQIPLLNPDDWKKLGGQVVDGKYLSQLEEKLVAKYGIQPAATDLLLALAERFCQAGLFFEALCQYLELQPNEGIAGKALHPKLRGAIDGHIDQYL